MNEREKQVLREVLAEIGAEPDLLLMRNSTGVAEYVDTYGKAWKVPYGIGGTKGKGGPDLIGILSGCFVAFEVKALDGVVSPDQKECHELWRRFGAYVGIVRCAKDARHHLDEARRHFRKKTAPVVVGKGKR